MLAEMAAISACILTALDNPVPALKLFIRSSLYASFVIFIYAYGIFPNIIEFWQLALVLAPFCIYCLMLFASTLGWNWFAFVDGYDHGAEFS